MSWLNLSEFYNVGILNNTEGYPFGAEGPVAGLWQYENAHNYATFNLILGVLWLLVFVLNIYAVLRLNSKFIRYSILFAVFVYLLSHLIQQL